MAIVWLGGISIDSNMHLNHCKTLTYLFQAGQVQLDHQIRVSLLIVKRTVKDHMCIALIMKSNKLGMENLVTFHNEGGRQRKMQIVKHATQLTRDELRGTTAVDVVLYVATHRTEPSYTALIFLVFQTE